MSLEELLAKKTKNNPLFLHIDAIGLLNFKTHIGNNISEILDNKLEDFNSVLNDSQKLGGNILIPAFSYSITNGELFDINKTKSDVGASMELLRNKNPEKRSSDPMFSYTVFSQDTVLQDREIRSYETFGDNDIISKVFERDGYIAGIGGAISKMTEAHFLERKLKVKYRFDKDFIGKVKIKNGEIIQIKHRFFCRDLSFNKRTDFLPIIQDARKEGMIEVWEEDGVQIEAIKMKTLYKLMKEKIDKEHFYFCKFDDLKKR
ncbi:aminoglycoside N3'-acetyltransferase [Thiovulum sp. ES]|nr:aminoglycoside N3'-acetyltransferase [Thiovulum sp. ES]